MTDGGILLLAIGSGVLILVMVLQIVAAVKDVW